MNGSERHFGGWIEVGDGDSPDWPKRPWQVLQRGCLPWDEDVSYVPLRLPESDLAAWIAAEIAKAEDMLRRIRAIAANDSRQVVEGRYQKFEAVADLIERNCRKIEKFERYIAACGQRLRAAAS